MSKEFEAFDRAMKRLLLVPHSKIKQRMDEYKERAKKNPNRRGPKPKRAAVTSSDVSGRDAG